MSVKAIYVVHVTNRRTVLRHFYVELLKFTGQKVNSTLFLMSPPGARGESTPWLNNCPCHPSRKKTALRSLQHLSSHHKQSCLLISGLSQWQHRNTVSSGTIEPQWEIDCSRLLKAETGSRIVALRSSTTLCSWRWWSEFYLSANVCRDFLNSTVSVYREEMLPEFPEAFLVSIIPRLLAVRKEK